MLITDTLVLEVEEVELVNKIAEKENISDWYKACDCCGCVSIGGIRTLLPDAIEILVSQMEKFKDYESEFTEKEKAMLMSLLSLADIEKNY